MLSKVSYMRLKYCIKGMVGKSSQCIVVYGCVKMYKIQTDYLLVTLVFLRIG